MERHLGPLELRAEGRTLTGPGIRYGDVSPSHRERFAAGAFDLRDGKTRWLNLRHDPERAIAFTNGGGLTLTDSREALMVRAELPEIPAADRALADVQAGRLRGFSIEFRAIEERRDSGIRVVQRAALSGLGLVGSPSYQQSTVEVRARSGRTMRARIPSDTPLDCRCASPECRLAEFASEALSEMINEGIERAVAGFGSYTDSPLASGARGTLRGRMVGKDAELEIDLPDSPVGAAVIAANEAAGVIVRPHLDAGLSVGVQNGETMVYSKATLRGVLVSATDAREGWPAPSIVATPGMDDERHAAPRRRRWL